MTAFAALPSATTAFAAVPAAATAFAALPSATTAFAALPAAATAFAAVPAAARAFAALPADALLAAPGERCTAMSCDVTWARGSAVAPRARKSQVVGHEQDPAGS